MDEVIIMNIREFLGRGVVYFGKYERGERRGVGCGRSGMFSQYGSIVSDAGTVGN